MVNGLFVDARRRARHRAPLPAPARGARRVRRSALPGEAPDPAHRDVERAERAGPPPRPDLGAAPLVARLHPEQPAPGAGRGDRLLPRLPHLHPGRRAPRSAPAIASTSLRAIRDAKRRNRRPASRSSTSSPTSCCCAIPTGCRDADRAERREFVLRFQQLTGPVMAKGLEDTVFYRYNPLASLNEVGGRPHRRRRRPRAPPRLERAGASQWPHALSATATHDTKRGEDVRARLDVLSEIPREWQRRAAPLAAAEPAAQVDRRRRPHPRRQRGVPHLPDADRRLADGRDRRRPDRRRRARRCGARIGDYMTKALREAKLHTSWINVNAPYERGVAQFIDLLLQPSSGDAVPRRAAALRRRASLMPGICNSLAQVVLKITAPGVPDIYQGTELWDLALVDPDNRRPVDFARAPRAAGRAGRARARGRAARRSPRALCASPGTARSSCW